MALSLEVSSTICARASHAAAHLTTREPSAACRCLTRGFMNCTRATPPPSPSKRAWRCDRSHCVQRWRTVERHDRPEPLASLPTPMNLLPGGGEPTSNPRTPDMLASGAGLPHGANEPCPNRPSQGAADSALRPSARVLCMLLPAFLVNTPARPATPVATNLLNTETCCAQVALPVSPP